MTRPELLADDGYDRALIDRVAPADWTNPAPSGRYHLVVIGAGTAGLVTAIAAAGLGARVALVERRLMGGDCLNFGCVPSKGVIAAARRWSAGRADAGFGAPGAERPGDFAAAMGRMRRIRAEIGRDDSAERFREAGVDVYLGEGRFVSGRAVAVTGSAGDRELRFRRAVVATGARPQAPPIAGLERCAYLTNETVFALTERPGRLAVIGAGPIGCELSQAFARLGSRVTTFDVLPGILPREDPDAAALVEGALRRDGVELALGARIEEAAPESAAPGEVLKERSGTGARLVWVDSEGERRETVCDELLVAAGRAPNVEGLGLGEAGVRSDAGGIRVDAKLRTTNPRIFAAGDVTPAPKYTHLADAHAAVVVQNALFFPSARADRLVVPRCTYTSPEVAHAGLDRREAEERGIALDVIDVALDENHRALLEGEEEGFLRVLLKRGSDRVLGATVVGAGAGDLIAPLALAVTHRVGLSRFTSTILPYPTRAEVLKRAANQWRRTRFTPLAQRLVARWFRFTSS